MDSKQKEKLEQCFYEMMDDCLEGVNADGQLRKVTIDAKKKEVIFTFDLVETPEGLSWYGY